MGVKIKHRDPKTTDFSRDDVVINFNEGSLFFKSKLGLHKVTATQVNVGSENNIIGIGGPDEVLFNNGGVIGGDIGFRIRPYSLTTVGGIGYSQTSGGTFADDNVLDVDLPLGKLSKKLLQDTIKTYGIETDMSNVALTYENKFNIRLRP